MKKFLKYLSAALWMLAVGAMAIGCDDPIEEEPQKSPLDGASVEISLISADIDCAVLSVKTQVVKHIAYAVVPTAENKTLTAEELFGGQYNMLVCDEDGTTEIVVEDLTDATQYTIYVAARVSSKYVMEEVKSLKFTTAEIPIVPVMRAELVSTSSTTAEISLYAEHLSRYAYVVYKVAEDGSVQNAPAAPLVFVQGTVGECVMGDNAVTIDLLSPNSEYVAYFAGEVAGKEVFMDEVISVTGIKTADFEQDIRIYDITYNSMKIDLKVDPAINELRHAIKMSAVDYYYNYAYTRAMDPSATNSMSYDSRRFANFCFTESTTIDVREDNYVRTQDGSLIEDETNGGYLTFFPNMAPGQPMVIRFGEYAWSDAYGEGWSYSKPMFNSDAYWGAQDRTDELIDTAPYWTGFYYESIVETQNPTELNTEIVYTIEKETNEATIVFEPNPDVFAYCIMPMNQSVYDQLMQNLLLGHEEYLQWFATSYSACQVDMLSAVVMNDGVNRCVFNCSSVTSVSPNQPIQLMITAIGGDIDANGLAVGNKQKFIREVVQLPDYSKPAPTLDITAGECTSTSISWNIKCTSGDADKVEYLVGYEYDWLTSGGLSDEEVKSTFMSVGGTQLSAMDTDMVNSANGYSIEFSSKPGTTSYIVVKATNDEGLVSYSSAVPATSLPEQKDEPATIPALDGQWTMTATVATENYTDESHTTTEWVEQQMSCTVTIGTDAITDVPATLPEDIYDIFEDAGVDREEADNYYGQFKEALNNFVEYTLEGQNRVLLNGWNLDPTGGSDMRYATPYELFTSESYNGYNAASPIKDFGPKWYMEFDQQGNVWVPFNIDYYGTLSGWTTFDYNGMNIIQEYHLVAANQKYGYVVPYGGYDENYNPIDGKFPVEISDDCNTITIHGIEDQLDGGEKIMYYPSVVTYSSQYISTYAYVVSDIVLTRGANAEASLMNRNAKKTRAVEQQTNANYSVERNGYGRRDMLQTRQGGKTIKNLRWMVE